ncbi:replication/maintenance protein RepL [Kitasatospora sp. NPDC002965]|uniref:replication/maintenance protein RepL n=1 Tax=Kitasatospora sp. NPDC002965 TaxID=3154775 RepID=UPI0033B5542E
MTDHPATRHRRAAPRAVPATMDDVFKNDLVALLGLQLGESSKPASNQSSAPKVKSVTVEYENRRGVHDMAGDSGYSLASNWFTQLLAQLAIAKRITKSELCVFLYIAGGQIKGTGITEYTQQEVADGLNERAKETGAPCISRSTVNRAIRVLCDYGWVERHGNGAVRLNVKLWFRGNSDEQHELLAELKSDDPTAFPNYIGPDLQMPLPFDSQDETADNARQERTG